eukprot:CAMPEP_0183292772 /NCGR_PEP_ID=MMETSP0160_2-20130417/1710_1 /TAXON_ID=2839 ORGANISM="Odontella Sinensis, Strain Grunow 1884" /NCGR_SAMPLE_ID=MMETSP0160_2 /ASSEMBLY_ACC=CAM_ASM_000250 /LENGTH=204 /DNA_ID=CAMNT_0025453779 /DNA_START=83 /DNA_END=694 /DNA_ORIENTATION=+
MVDFRNIQRDSNFRANVFLIECIAVLAVYLRVLYHLTPEVYQQHRSILLATFGVIYIIRLNFMSRYLLQREIAIEELTIVILIWIPSILSSFLLVTAKQEVSISESFTAVGAYAIGSFLNSYSEFQRKKWKAIPSNKGRCYTGGLFSLCRNINYFGDTVLFAGWAAATGNWRNMWVPLVMGTSFIYHHIPEKERYLAKRYGRDW